MDNNDNQASEVIEGFVDYHTHLLRDAAGGQPAFMYGDVASYHWGLVGQSMTPMDDAPEPIKVKDLSLGVDRSLKRARGMGLCEIWEAGMDHYSYLHVLLSLREHAPLPLRVRILVASGLADREGMPERTGDTSVEVEGVKFYADGWLGTRTCAVWHPFEDVGHCGVLFHDAGQLARRMEPYALDGWAIATHAIGDRAVDAVIDAYCMVFGSDCRDARPRIEHASLLSDSALERLASTGIEACVQPGFAISDAEHVRVGLNGRRYQAFRWRDAVECGVRLLYGSDAPLESLDPVASVVELGRQMGELTPSRSLLAATSPLVGRTILDRAFAPGETPTVVRAEPSIGSSAPSVDV